MTNRDHERGEPDLDNLLRALSQDDAQVRAPESLHARVMEAWDAKQRPTVSKSSIGSWLGRAAALAAAAVLAIVWLIARGDRGPSVGEPPVSQTTVAIDAAANLVIGPPLETDSLQLVRVRMPRGALRAFGIALVDPDAAAEVEVDVVVGEDGFPRSIRRVQPIAAGGR